MLKSLFNKVSDYQAATLLKRDSNTGVFLWNLWNFYVHRRFQSTSLDVSLMCLTKTPSIRNWNLFSAYSQNLFSKVVIILGFHIDIRNMNDVLNVLKAESCLLVFNILRALTPFFQYWNIGLLIFLILAYYSNYQPMKFMNTVNFLRSEKVQQFE